MLEIKESKIHGLGLFATQNIAAGIKLYNYVGIEMSWNDFVEKYGSYKENSLNTYPMRRIHKIIVAKDEPYKSQNLVNFINEGEPNVILKRKALYSLREIQAGEELLLKYPNNYNRYWIKKCKL